MINGKGPRYTIYEFYCLLTYFRIIWDINIGEATEQKERCEIFVWQMRKNVPGIFNSPRHTTYKIRYATYEIRHTINLGRLSRMSFGRVCTAHRLNLNSRLSAEAAMSQAIYVVTTIDFNRWTLIQWENSGWQATIYEI